MVEDANGLTGKCQTVAVNDNESAESRIDTAVLTLARLIGRQIAREAFEQLSAANDNRPAPKADEE